MKKIVIGAFALAILSVSSAEAQQAPRVHPSKRYCMDMGGDEGGAITVCQFNTMEQCLASRRSQGEPCYLNPYLAFEQQRKRK